MQARQWLADARVRLLSREIGEAISLHAVRFLARSHLQRASQHVGESRACASVPACAVRAEKRHLSTPRSGAAEEAFASGERAR